ncbi:peptidoglycan-binding domain-containing protein [Cocleimonas sp. KMM 6892]|uniref:peptidoglycan-binding domain-containing protein n=1 Tax=unclassified Cocleimonas TaxID=2639732 RepID=UPI002DBA0EA9|nr:MULTISPECIES: peptidoglycan-binding domain-containing protein [unclassified Cocleimonas]MEB8432823.1 peptidoglycan-binding domain-containing protein [Cocleimonas sp. KMM 6892]MEC4715682.1 peptidoglycan-binding domain-containing protein [Cocleimonas sp. KMM 6895]MEC4744700.1 peptidoglycan-binding domain-containing protein [Cocleimonas sp. KMM 6896]
MPTYNPSFITQQYLHTANSPFLDKVVFTIDHLHEGGPGIYSTFDVVKHLVSKQIPVTIFIQCSDPLNFCPAEKRIAQSIYDLDHNLVSLGAHALTRGNSQANQSNNLDKIKDVIADITGAEPRIMSYHGSNAGPENGISYADITYARGITSVWSDASADNPLNTPVMNINSVNAAYDFIQQRNAANLSATLFVHSVELTSGSVKKLTFDTIVADVIGRRLQALPYLSAMQSDYTGTPPTPGPTQPIDPPPGAPCPLRHFTNTKITQYLRVNKRDGVNGVFQVAELQRFLNELGLGAGTADGIFGSNTKLAVISYQIIKGLGPDGIVGANTRASINAYCD